MNNKSNIKNYRHVEKDYLCAMCAINNGIEGDFPYSKQSDIVFRDEDVICFIASHWWPNNKAHLLVIPAKHYENVYELPDDLGNSIMKTINRAALALKSVYKCSGVTIIQNNEPDGDQEVFHVHFHVFPRYKNDNFHQNIFYKSLSEPKEREKYARKIRKYFSEKVGK